MLMKGVGESNFSPYNDMDIKGSIYSDSYLKNIELDCGDSKKQYSFLKTSDFENLVNVVVSLVTKKQKQLKITFEGDSSYTNGEIINIGIPDFLLNCSPKEILFSVIALAIHESEHIVNSSFLKLNKYNLDLEKEFNSFIVSIGLNINNCIEDGRIERIDKIKYPNNLKYLNNLRVLWHKLQPISNAEPNISKENLYYKAINDTIFAICSIATTSKLPLDWEKTYTNSKYDEFIQSIKKSILDSVNMNNYDDSFIINDRIFRKFIEFFKEEIELSSKCYNSVYKLYGEILEGCEGSGKLIDALGNDSDLDKKILSSIKDILEKLKPKSNKENKSIDKFDENNIAISSKGFQPKVCSTKTYKVSSSKSPFRVEVTRLKAQVKKILDDKYCKDRFDVKSGRINSNTLWKTALLEQRIFKKTYWKKEKNTALYFLIDSSGSMISDNKMNVANKISSIIEEAFSEFINLEIAFFNDYHEIVRKFDTDDKKHFVWSCNKQANGGNSDFENIKIARETLQKRSEKNKLIIIISDGLPCPNAHFSNPIVAVQQEVSKAKLKGIETIAIALENHNSDYKKMYKHIVYTDVNDIYRKLCLILKKVIA